MQISGPTGAFIAVLAVITAQHGIAGLQLATLMAGLILQRTGTRVVLCEVRANVIEQLERAGISARVGARGVYGTLSEFAASISN